MMDDRTRRLGQHTAQTAPPGQSRLSVRYPPTRPPASDWARKAASIAAYREMYGYDHPDDPIGPEPSHHAKGL